MTGDLSLNLRVGKVYSASWVNAGEGGRGRWGGGGRRTGGSSIISKALIQRRFLNSSSKKTEKCWKGDGGDMKGGNLLPTFFVWKLLTFFLLSQIFFPGGRETFDRDLIKCP